MAETLGAYALTERIAVGGMAEVFLARPPADLGPSHVVVKRILPQLLSVPEMIYMFLDEGKLGAMLSHPGIVAIYDLGEADGTYYLALEYVDGPDFAHLVAVAREAGVPLPVELVVYIAAEAAEALAAAHRARHPETGEPLHLVHRDVTPQNILVGRDGAVKLTDFGVAKSDAQFSKTATGVIKGKIAYMAAEQILGEPLDARTDVFGLGVTLFEALTGTRPFRGANEVELIQAILGGRSLPFPERAGVDPILQDVVLRMMAHRPEDRIPSAPHVRAALDRWLSRRGPASRETLARWMQRHVVRTETPEPFGWQVLPRPGQAAVP